MWMTRREFHKTSIALGAGTALSSLRVVGANDRVNVGLIGCGGRGRQVLKIFLTQPDAAAVAVCDVYEPFRTAAAAMRGAARLP
jgi:hypothetical protein